jgi:GNAT superfamily N-acetyltransferase
MNANDISVRRGLPTDAAAIERLYNQLVNNPSVCVLPERIAQLATDPNTALFVTEGGGAVNGTALVSLCGDVMFGSQPYAVVENFVVDAGSKGQGAGAALMSKIESFCYASECSKIMLLSSAQRVQAHQFFEHMGFVGNLKRGFVKYRRDFSSTNAQVQVT